MERKIVVCIIENDKKEILLQKKTLDYKPYPGGWCLFGGEAESEDINKEMNRELEEEIGIKPPIKLIFNHKIIINKEEKIIYIFSAKLNNISTVKIGEGAGVAFFGKKELKNLDIHPEDREILNKYLKEF
jgi:8-oxo-dGTP pyrophosphatase MutT (NUDIX family)